MPSKQGEFKKWFADVTGHSRPSDWQHSLAGDSTCRSRMVRIPTGLGKSEGVLSAWSFHRISKSDDRWPRRLVWCLPMRVLVEQTAEVAQRLADKIAAELRPHVYVAMGGEDGREWFLEPERPAIIVGTQDMLLSRALNRGYGSPRARWPMEFGLLSQDSLWIMDEVQLMDVGLATSAQLQAFREQDHTKSLRPSYTWWMSATLQPEWLRSVDTANNHNEWMREPCVVEPQQRTGGLWDVSKSLDLDNSIKRADAKGFAKRTLAAHAELKSGGYGRITLVVCNTVERACETHEALQAAGRLENLELVHSRFRPAEREKWRKEFLSRSACSPNADRIIVATQVVEAGVDISAGCLITELAPWPSLVQRFGRCARYSGSGTVIVVDRGRDESGAAPYAPEELESAWASLEQLRRKGVGIAELEAYEDSLSNEEKKRLYPYSPSHLLLRREFDELFDTTPDLTGADLDISRFIRSGEERDLQVFWVDVEKDEQPPVNLLPHRRELCAVPFLRARNWLCGKETSTNRQPRLSNRMRAWVWDWIDGKWIVADRSKLLPGRIVCVAAECGGYLIERGFNPGSRESVPVVSQSIPAEAKKLDEADSRQDGENLSFNDWKTIACHGAEVVDEVRMISQTLQLPERLQRLLTLGARYHDWGKSHPAFQGAMRADDRPSRIDLAKGPKSAWLKPPGTYRSLDDGESRPAFRHELASALALFNVLAQFAPQHDALLGPWSEVLNQIGQATAPSATSLAPPAAVQPILDCSAEEFDLLVYLVAAHHGKVRVALHASPKDQEYRDADGRGLPIRGIREGDCLPSVRLDPSESSFPEVTLTLAPATIGLSGATGASWRERCLGLLERFGPGALAFLEAILRAADVRASRLKTNDPTLISEASA